MSAWLLYVSYINARACFIGQCFIQEPGLPCFNDYRSWSFLVCRRQGIKWFDFLQNILAILGALHFSALTIHFSGAIKGIDGIFIKDALNLFIYIFQQ
jgi:hypothetical protein